MPENDDRPIRPDAVSPAVPEPAGPSTGPSMEDLLGGGGLDMGALLEQAAKMQEGIAAAQQQVTDSIVEGAAGGGVVKVVVTGAMEFRSVSIDPTVVDPDDVEMLQDLILAAVNEATRSAQALQQRKLGGIAGGLGGGLGLPGL